MFSNYIYLISDYPNILLFKQMYLMCINLVLHRTTFKMKLHVQTKKKTKSTSRHIIGIMPINKYYQLEYKVFFFSGNQNPLRGRIFRGQ